ncbi:phenylalanyl-tRNA synthetase alpha subunit, mitochondrial [Metarhizium acridum]|nr:phenylalanyl-tRNA synthetase alpha subunit, mitochondrial [Metarhizium acridum]
MSVRIGAMRGLLRCSRQVRSSRHCSIRPSHAIRQFSSSGTLLSSKPANASNSSVSIRGGTYKTDPAWFNVPSNVLDATSRKLHLQKDHPVYITRQIIESNFPPPTYKYYNEYNPVVSTHQNFDSLGFPPNHPGEPCLIPTTSTMRLSSEHTRVRTQADTFRADESDGYLISADVYRRDAIDRSHYPVFHQMEGARSWDRNKVHNGDVAAAVRADLETLPKHNVQVEDPNPPYHDERNPLQDCHSAAEAQAIGEHLKRSLENMVVDVFSRAKAAALREDPTFVDEPLRMRWVEAYFPFTSPSWELEVYYAGDWLEVLGCGVVRQSLYNNAGVPSQLGWAFGIGIDRIAMLLFKIPDIRLFWSQDQRFLSQFTGVSDNLDKLKRFAPFSKYPPCPKDVSFWLASTSPAGGNTKGNFHENDVMEIVRNVAGDVVEDVRLIDEFVHPKTGRKSMAYRIVYRSLERTLTNEEANSFHKGVREALVRELGVELR